jgi:hypothetical protein
MWKKEFQIQGVDTTKMIDPISIVPGEKRMGHIKQKTVEYHGMILEKIDKRKKTKVNLQNQQKVIHLNLPITLLFTAI